MSNDNPMITEMQRYKRFLRYTNNKNKKKRICFVGAYPYKSSYYIYLQSSYFKKASNIPAATAEPITPATFGPIACINK